MAESEYDVTMHPLEKVKCAECKTEVTLSVMLKRGTTMERKLIHIGRYVHLLAASLYDLGDLVKFAPALIAASLMSLYVFDDIPELFGYVDLSIRKALFFG